MLVLLCEHRNIPILFLGFDGERAINNNPPSQVKISEEIDQVVGNQKSFVFGQIGVAIVAQLSTSVFLAVLCGAPCSAPHLQTALPRAH